MTVELLIALKAYISTCNLRENISIYPLGYTSDLVLSYKTPAELKVEEAENKLKQAKQELDCENATKKLIEEYDKLGTDKKK